MHRKRIVYGLGLALLGGGLLGAGPAWTKTPKPEQVVETADISHYPGWEDPVMADVAVSTGRALVQHLHAARAMLDEDQVAQARDELTNSQEFARSLQRMMPYVVVADDVRDARDHLLDSGTSVLYDDLLPIDAHIDEMELYAPKLARQSRAKLDHAKQQAGQGDKEGAAATLKEVADDVSATTIYLPVDFIDGQIFAARHALEGDHPDLATARQAVDNALDSVSSVTTWVDSPS